jgi:hypothetical protein
LKPAKKTLTGINIVGVYWPSKKTGLIGPKPWVRGLMEEKQVNSIIRFKVGYF